LTFCVSDKHPMFVKMTMLTPVAFSFSILFDVEVSKLIFLFSADYCIIMIPSCSSPQ